MPTKKQLFDLWKADSFLGPYGDRPDLYGDRPAPKPINDFTGESIGTISYDPETDDLVVHIDDKEEKKDINPIFP